MAPRRAPILAVIPPPAQYALTLLAGIGLDRLLPWRPVWMTAEGVRWAGSALAVRDSFSPWLRIAAKP